ncbi:SDR family NAD(P)-dependent oxidoreductase [Streptomyces niger]|uniref:SDR family NAD(P)-dependent oxidoreductase n=1 Tax=Streptomyces niger TaxID=66373 RepID=UPI001F204249|nr:SDR family NAD(P)-dependent oxidoreductase [Streptomyces niger]
MEDLRAVGGESAGTVRFVAADVSDLACVRQLAADAEAVDVLVNNASVMTFSPTTGQVLASYDATFAVNVRAPFLLTVAAHRSARGEGEGIRTSVAWAWPPHSSAPPPRPRWPK